MFDSFDDIVNADPADVTPAQLTPLAVAAHRLMEQARLALVGVLGEVDASFEYRAAGHASPTGWLRTIVDISDSDAGRLVTLARHLRRAEVIAAAVAAGDATTDPPTSPTSP